MKKSIVLLLLSLMIFLSPTSAEVHEDAIVHNIEEFQIGRKLEELNIDAPNFYEPHKSIVIDSTFSFPYIRVSTNGVIYDVCYDWNYRIRYIAVEEDPTQSFSTPEGIRLNMDYEDCKKIFGRKKLMKNKLIGYYIQLPSDWYISFWTGKSGIDYYPKKGDIIYCIFKK